MCGRERNRKEGSEERTGRLRALEVDVAGLSGQRKDLGTGSPLGRELGRKKLPRTDYLAGSRTGSGNWSYGGR